MKSALKSSSKPPAKPISTETQQSNNLLDGQFDEDKSHNSFLEALNAWRGVKTDNTNSGEPGAKAVRFEGEPVKTTAGKNFLANIDSNNTAWNMDCVPTWAEEGTKPDEKLSDPKFGPKESCWQCYKLFPKDTGETCRISGKNFCKAECLARYEKEHVFSC